jgi:fermentation-respiration switch protein FrsA (DUF1100 family)
MASRVRRRSAGLVALPLLFLGMMSGILAGIVDRFVYFPTREHDGGTPRAIGAPYEDVHLRTADGIALHAWFVPAEAARLALLLLHGNAGNISHRLEKLSVLRSLGASVLLLDYRGFGHSEGTPDEEGTYRDADAAYDWLTQRLSAEKIVLYGESLGGAVAAELATRRPTAGLILESSPSSILEVAKAHYPFLPMRALLSIRYDALQRISRLSVPLLILHSRQDAIVPYEMAERLYAAARGPKRLVPLRGGHNDAFLVDAAVYRSALEEFLSSIPRG